MKYIKPLFFVYLAMLAGVVVLAIVQSPWWLVAAGVMLPLALVGIHDLVQKDNAVLRNFPVVGHLRYLSEAISPEIQQYFIERHTDGTPVSENHRNLVYARSEGRDPTHPFGTELDLYEPIYDGLEHSLYPVEPMVPVPRVTIGNDQCEQPYEASLFNISAMSFGALSPNAVLAFSGGAKQGGFYVNTGEGSLSEYHLRGGGEIVWQIGTGYFGCRTQDGDFDPEEFRKRAREEQVRMIELKLSQGAKPGHGGVLPAKKNTKEIAKIRLLEPHTTVRSPPGHREFNDAEGLLRFLARLRSLSGGKPVGFKICLGNPAELPELCAKMVELDIVPDFITVDGAEGGTGAAPLEFTDSVGHPIRHSLPLVDQALKDHGLRERVRIIASGKVLTGYDLLRMLALGADLCNAARAFMLAVGCIQALRCDTNSCPTGVATMDPRLYGGLVPETKAGRVAAYHGKTLKLASELAAAAGLSDPRTITPEHFMRRLAERAPWVPAKRSEEAKG